MARPNKSGLTPDVIRTFLNQRNPETGKFYTLADIARHFDVDLSYPARVMKRAGKSLNPRQEMRDQYWVFIGTDANTSKCEVAKRLGDHLEYKATNGEGMSCTKRQRYKRWIGRLIGNNEVVEFDPAIPPSEGIRTGGWAYRPRTENDGQLVIRENEHTQPLTPVSREIWKLPPTLPRDC